MTLAIAHREGERIVLDCVAERKAPFSPDFVVSEFADTLKAYRISTIVGDRYGGEWPSSRFSVHGVTYRPAELNRSELYLTFLPLVNSGRADLLDNPRLITQFLGLERRTSRAGKDSVDHAPGAHDDIANSVAGAFAIVGSTGKNTGFLNFYEMQAKALPKRREIDGVVTRDLRVSRDGVLMPWAI